MGSVRPINNTSLATIYKGGGQTEVIQIILLPQPYLNIIFFPPANSYFYHSIFKFP